ncbi:hypothetical protein LZ32DRAFT_544325 [Colletotrichum eremochloae]|nr:hypothetical protein LZ32DRAFT_544325 [Colletotrichum eremochloae]
MCRCGRCTPKQDAIEVMDLVYLKSNFPVALLVRPASSEDELLLFASIMECDFSWNNWLSINAPRVRARRALLLLHLITSDRWWTRAWTY